MDNLEYQIIEHENNQKWIKVLSNPYLHLQMITPYGLGSGKQAKVECAKTCKLCEAIREVVPDFKGFEWAGRNSTWTF